MSEISDNEPLTLTRFGIQMRRMTEAEQEIVRTGRNKEFVRNNHVYREVISVQQHEAWCREVASPLHYVLVIRYHERDVGAMIVKDIDPETMNCTCGGFIWDEDFLGSKVPILSLALMLDFFFSIGINRMNSIVLKSNLPAIKMNTFFGFSFAERDDESFSITMEKSTYLANKDRLIAFAYRACKNKDDQELKIGGKKSLLNLPAINALLPD